MQNAKDQHRALGPLNLSDYKPQDERLAKIVAVAEPHPIVEVGAVKRGYSSTETVTYADQHIGHAEQGLGVLLPWRLCSGFAHGRPWANLSFSERQKVPTADPNIVAMRFSTDLGRALYLVMAAMIMTEELLKVHALRSRPPY